MQLTFRVLGLRSRNTPSWEGQVFLRPGEWDDYSFKTSFDVVLMNVGRKLVELGTIKIGYKGQSLGWTREKIIEEFESLPGDYFSLGQDVKYYKSAYDELAPETRRQLLTALRDVAFDDAALDLAREELVFRNSLTRGVSLTTVRDQFKRVLAGKPELTNFDFTYVQAPAANSALVELSFQVIAGSKPSTNVHVLIGRNGVGKTTLLNNMVRSLTGQQQGYNEKSPGFYANQLGFFGREPLSKDYFSRVVAVSFSAFDSFIPPSERVDRSAGPAFFYVGMKKGRVDSSTSDIAGIKTSDDHLDDFEASFKSCISQPTKRDRLLDAIRCLGSDSNFMHTQVEMLLTDLQYPEQAELAAEFARAIAETLSSGHAVVLLTITKLVETVDEKTLVLLDEPESHLHPPLLSAFTRALSNLLHDRNGVAIVATHSPVVIQEVPKSCVWKITRFQTECRADRLERETFGENVGVLTREVFGLEVSKSGFHKLLSHSVSEGGSFEYIMESYGWQIGVEAQAILRSLIAVRDAAELPK